MDEQDRQEFLCGVDVSNLRFYSRLFELHKWETTVISWTSFHQTLKEIADRREEDGKQLRAAREKIAELEMKATAADWLS